jgi:hypothetical protein
MKEMRFKKSAAACRLEERWRRRTCARLRRRVPEGFGRRFEITDLGDARYILGIQVTRGRLLLTKPLIFTRFPLVLECTLRIPPSC